MANTKNIESAGGIVYVIEKEGVIIGICDNELDALRCLVFRGYIDLDEVYEKLHQDAYTFLANGATIDDLAQFCSEGSVYSIHLNYDTIYEKDFRNCLGTEFSDMEKKDFIVKYGDGDERRVSAYFKDEAKYLAERQRENEGLPFVYPQSVFVVLEG